MKSAKHTISHNIPILYLIRFCEWFMLYMPVVKLFYEENNLSNFQLFLLHAIYSAVIALFEIPSGYAADMWGRKKALVLGLFFGFAGFLCYSFAYGFVGFLLAEIALGIGQGFVSGSDTALLYDTLAQDHKQKTYVRQEGKISATGNFAEAAAGILVTLLAFSVMRKYYYIQTGIMAGAFLLSFLLIEPAFHKYETKTPVKSLIKVIGDTLWENKLLSRLILFSSLIGFASLSMAWFAQIFLYQTGIKHESFGIIWTALNAVVALGSLSAYFISQRLNINLLMILFLLLLSGGFIMASQNQTGYGLIVFFIFYYVRGGAHPILKNLINQNTSSHVRATVLSVRSLLIRMLFAFLGPFLGWMTDKISLSFALILCGTFVLINGVWILSPLILRSSKTNRRTGL